MVFAQMDSVCPICWDWCAEHSERVSAKVVFVDLVDLRREWHSMTPSGHWPVELQWVDVNV